MTSSSSKYTLGRRIAGGGMGEVYEGVTCGADGFRRRVAIKTVRPSDPDDSLPRKLRDDLRREAHLCAKLDHPSIISVYDLHQTRTGELWIVMEYVDGPDLARLLQRSTFSVAVVVHIVRAVASALAHAHTLSIVHGDLSPHNILVNAAGQVKIADFGLAFEMTGNSVSDRGLRGKHAYFSPEQLDGRKVDHRIDLYALGVIVYELLTHQLPYGGHDGVAQFIHLMHEQTRLPLGDLRPEVPPMFRAVIDKLLARNREQRYQTAAEVLHDLGPEMSAAQELGAIVTAYRQDARNSVLSVASSASTPLMRPGADRRGLDGEEAKAAQAQGIEQNQLAQPEQYTDALPSARNGSGNSQPANDAHQWHQPRPELVNMLPSPARRVALAGLGLVFAAAFFVAGYHLRNATPALTEPDQVSTSVPPPSVPRVTHKGAWSRD